MMRVTVMVMLLALLSVGQATSVALDKSRPVTKIINMMHEMIEELTKEGEEDGETYEKMGCWCETNDKAKTKAIADGDAHVKALTTSIESLTSTSARLNTEIKSLTAEVKKNDEALDSATELRRKQLAEFNAEEKDMLASITSMKGAVVALSKHHESFLQVSASLHRTNSAASAGVTASASTTAAALASLKLVLKKHDGLVGEIITPYERNVLDNYFEVATPAMLQGSLQHKQPQSGAIFGILKGMKENFEKNLAQSQKEEKENNGAYEDLKAAKTSEIEAGTNLIETKTQELASADEKNAASKQDLEDTSETLETDVAFLATVKSKCENMDAEYAERTKTRQTELGGVNKALSFLTSDEAHDLFTRTFNFLFVQVRGQTSKRQAISAILMRASKHVKDPRFALLQSQVRNAVFDKVVKDIQEMVDKLVKEKQDEIDLRDFCTEEFHKNQMAHEQSSRDKADLEAKIDDLHNTVKTLTKEIKDLETAIKEAQVEMKRAGEDREIQNKELQVTVADQRATQKLLRGALRALKSVYDASLMQNSDSRQPEFKSYEKNKKSGGVTGMIEDVIGDAQKLEAEAIRAEEESQKAYEDFVKDTNTSIETMTKDKTNKEEANAKSKTEKVEAETERDNVDSNIEGLEKAATDLHGDCDYTLKNFDMKQGARDDEIGALKQAISIFSGASFIQFLQKE